MPQQQTDQLAVLLIRLLALVFAGLAAWDLLLGLIEIFIRLNPNYFLHYLTSILPRPAAGMVVSAAIFLLSRPLANFLTGRPDDENA